jgi:hypothetical protein
MQKVGYGQAIAAEAADRRFAVLIRRFQQQGRSYATPLLPDCLHGRFKFSIRPIDYGADNALQVFRCAADLK